MRRGTKTADGATRSSLDGDLYVPEVRRVVSELAPLSGNRCIFGVGDPKG